MEKIVQKGTVGQLLQSQEENWYVVHFDDIKNILQDASIPFKKVIMNKNHIAILVDDAKIDSSELLERLVKKYSILEFYKKKQTLIDKIYQS